MATTAQYLEQLQNDKQVLVDNLVAKGVEASSDETFTTLAPKVADIEAGGGAEEYWDLENKKTSGTAIAFIKKIPLLDVSGFSNLNSFLSGFQILEEIPNLNISKATNVSSMFNQCRELKTIPNLDTSNVTNMSNFFLNCNELETIPELEAGKVTYISNVVMYCDKLVNLGGFKDLGKAYSTSQSANYGQYSLNLNGCNNLSHESLMNVINNLYNIASLGVQPQQLALGTTNKAKLTAEEIAIATNKGWTVS